MKNKKAFWIVLAVSGALTLIICAVMNLVFIPQIESAAQGLRCFDMRFGYTFDEAYQFLTSLSAEGRSVYLTRQLPLDFFYPVAYGVFFALLFVWLRGKKTALIALPVLLAAADYCENISILLMLRQDPADLANAAVQFASAATVTKTALMYLCFVLIVALLIVRLIKKRKQS